MTSRDAGPPGAATAARSDHLALSCGTLGWLEWGDAAAPAVLMLHGWPQAGDNWTAVAARLGSYRILAPDLPGIGRSQGAQQGGLKREIAGLLVEWLDRLAIERLHLVGADVGGQVAYALAAQQRERVLTLAVIESLIAGFGLRDLMHVTPKGGQWQLSFQQASDVALMLIKGREPQYFEWLIRSQSGCVAKPTADELAACVRAYSVPDGLACGLAWFRAIFDDATDNRLCAQSPLAMPVLAIDAAQGLGDATARCFEQLAARVRPAVVANCGHWVANEQPDVLAELLGRFWAQSSVVAQSS